MFGCMMSCIGRSWAWLLGAAAIGALVGLVIGVGSLAPSGGLSWPAILIVVGAGAFLGFAFAIAVTASTCSRTCRV